MKDTRLQVLMPLFLSPLSCVLPLFTHLVSSLAFLSLPLALSAAAPLPLSPAHGLAPSSQKQQEYPRPFQIGRQTDLYIDFSKLAGGGQDSFLCSCYIDSPNGRNMYAMNCLVERAKSQCKLVSEIHCFLPRARKFCQAVYSSSNTHSNKLLGFRFAKTHS